MSSTTVIHIRDAPPGWKQDPEFVYIGRGSLWGNPYPIGGAHPDFPWIPMTREMVLELFKERSLPILKRHLPLLKGKVLVCFCKPLPCHGDTLAELADKE